MNARRSIARIATIAALVLIGVVGAAFALRLVTLQRHAGYFAPAFSPDGKSVVVVERRARGITWGLGWEHFTPPAHARVLSDELRLLRVSLDGAKIEMLDRWAATPVAGRTLQQYRGRMFNHLRAGLRPLADGSIDYGFEFALPRIPASEVHQLHGVWSLDTARRKRGDWGRAPYAVLGLSEPVIAGERELFELPGPEGFPAAVAMLDHARKQVRIVIAAPDYDARYPKGPSIDQLMAVSRKADHDRLMAMKRIQQEREALYRSQGMLPNDATLKSYRDLQELGFLSRPPRWVAQRIGAAELASMSSAPRFDIDEMEFKVGLMSDLAQAIAQPGAKIDQHMGRYITHRDYPNAARLNEVLERGATELVIRYRGEDFHLRLLPRVEAKKDLAR